MKIGILTFHHSNYNYGAVLQAFAIYKLIENVGYTPFVINFIPQPPTLRKKIAARIIAILGFHFWKFRVNNIPGILPPTNSLSKLKELNNILDAFIVGSDQVWRYRNDLESMYRYYLDFVDDEKVKIAYAASFGIDYWEADEKVTQKIRTLVNRFNAVSVREKSGVKICKNTFGITCTDVLDPTLLIDPMYFNELADKKSISNSKKGRLVYMILDDSVVKENYFKKVASKNNLKFTPINGKKLLSRKGLYLFKSVNTWLSHIKNAEIVITDSFHCTVFSIIFRKKFVCLGNKHRGITRLQNLLNLLKLESRLIVDINDFHEELIKSAIDYRQVDGILLNEKIRSLDFLKKSLSLAEKKHF